MDILSLENLPSLDQIEKRLPQNERINHVTLNSYLGQTVFHLRTEKGSYDIPADSTERLPVIDWNHIQRVGITMEYLFHSEGRFLVHLGPMDSIRSFKRGIPIYKFHFCRSGTTMNYTYPLNPGRFCNIRIKTVVSGLGSGRSLIGSISLPCGKTLNYG